MKTTNPNIIAEQSSGLLSVTEGNGEIVIQLKNSSTLTIKPIVNEENISFDYTFLNGKEQKSIDKRLEKIAKINEEIAQILNGEGSTDEDSDEDAEDNTDTSEE